MEDWERERQQEEAHPSLGSELWKRRFPAHRERFERMDRNVAERGGLEDAVQAWQEPVLEGVGLVEELDNQNHEVKIALLHLTGAVAGEMARQSGAARGSE